LGRVGYAHPMLRMKSHYQSLFRLPSVAAIALVALLALGNVHAQILVSIEPYRELAERLAPDQDVTVLLPPGASPHGYDPSPRDVARIADAGWIVMNGGGVDDFITDLMEAAGSNAHTFVAVDALGESELLASQGDDAHEHGEEDHDHGAEEEHAHGEEDHDHGAEEDHGHEDDAHAHGEEDHGHGAEEEHAHGEEDHDHVDATHDHDDEAHDHDHDHTGPNAHVWLDPTRMITITHALADALAAEDPTRADAIQQRADAYVRELEVLDAEIAELLAPYEGAAFIPFHDAWPYFAERYGLNLVMEIEPFPGREPTARQLAAAIAIIEEYGATAIFSEVQLPDRPAQVLADEAGVALGILDPLGGSEARPTYHDLVRYNAQVIADTLTPTQP